MKKIVFILALSGLFSCGRFGNREHVAAGEQRIVCLSKQLTEMMFAIGKGKNIVAVDLSSTFPDSAKLLKTVGYHRALSPEAIIAVNPDLVIHSNDIGPENVLPQIKTAGLKVEAFGGANSPDSARLLLTALGKYFDVPAQATAAIARMDSGLALATRKAAEKSIQDSPLVMVIHFGRASNVYFVMSGRGGVPDKMISMAGGRVVKYDAKGARQISAEAVATANPDVIIATDYGFDKMGGMDKFISDIPGVALTNAGKNKRIVRFEEHDLIYFGPRSGDNIIKLMDLIHTVPYVAK
ncbi:MAG: transporter substrate-binding protein [Ferruginibacter sp.]|nr:transporter substrate-binding protein [Ferruginibacter sp.]